MSEPIKLSNSSISDYFECKRCFWLKINRGLKTPPGMFSGMPMVVDSLLKKTSMAYEGGLPPYLEGKINGEIIGGEEWKQMKSMTWNDPKSGIELKGLPDVAFVRGKGPKRVIFFGDYKTTGNRDPKIYDNYQRQQDIYTFLAEQSLGKDCLRDAYLIYFYPVISGKESENGLPIRFECFVKLLTPNPLIVPPLLKELAKYLNSSTPEKSSPECKYCNYISQRETFKNECAKD